MSRSILALFLALTASTASTAAANAQTPLTADAINAAVFADWAPETGNTDPDPFLVRVQVLLERIHVSPGVIDGFAGDNLAKAVRLFEETAGLPIDGEVDAAFWDALQTGSAPAVGVYEITQADLESRFVAELPTDYALMAEMDWLGYQGPREMLAERFHMDENLLQALNPDADFSVPGTRIIVADPGERAKTEVRRIEVRRSEGLLLAFDEADKLVAAYPASVGSTATPSPTGAHEVRTVAMEPTYTYRPDVNFQQGKNDTVLTIPPGPNGPVGSVWIDLSEPTYGIHGTPDPALIDKVNSHGCVRLTNWSAEELAKIVQSGTVVEFKD